MPKTKTDYLKTVMYKIVCNDITIKDVYVGSTTSFTHRKSTHKTASKGERSKFYQFIRDNGGWDNFSMILIEEYPCKTSLEKLARERYWIEKLGPTLNSRMKILVIQKKKRKIERQNINVDVVQHTKERIGRIMKIQTNI
jgi:hypothetical protein